MRLIDADALPHYTGYVTDDQFEFPIYIEESITDLAQRLGKTELAIRSAVCHAEKKGRKSQYRRVKKYD